MNYYEHHIGDFDQATAHLTACEDGIYSRLIRRYYATEKPLPPEISSVQRLVRARTKDEKQSVRDMLSEFFILQEDGWHNVRCDEEIARYRAGEPERELRKANEDNRVKRHRDERARLFRTLTDAGRHAPWNIGMTELRALVTGLATAAVPEPVTAPVTAPVTPATATQAPSTSHQTPDTNTKRSKALSGKPDLPPGFIRFWTAWPKTERKQGRAQCFDIWKRKSLEADTDQIVTHVEKMKLSESWRTGFDPMPETYLNGRRWDGAELDAPANGKPSAPVMLCEFRGEHFNLQLDPCGMAPAQKGSIYGGRALCAHHKRQIDDSFEEKTPMPDEVRKALAGLVRKVAA